MRRKLIGIALSLGLILGSFGLGMVAAQWLSTKTANQTVTIGGMTITITATHGTVVGDVVTCDPFTVASEAGTQSWSDGCSVTLTASGPAAPADLTMSMVADVTTAHLIVNTAATANAVSVPGWDGGGPNHQNFSTVPTQLGHVSGAALVFPFKVLTAIYWQNVSTPDFGTAHLTYTIVVAAA